MNKYILSKKEKEGAIELFKELDGDLNEAAKRLFEDPNERVSTIRGRALRKLVLSTVPKLRKKAANIFYKRTKRILCTDTIVLK